jgi:hypothetical protein
MLKFIECCLKLCDHLPISIGWKAVCAFLLMWGTGALLVLVVGTCVVTGANLALGTSLEYWHGMTLGLVLIILTTLVLTLRDAHEGRTGHKGTIRRARSRTNAGDNDSEGPRW